MKKNLVTIGIVVVVVAVIAVYFGVQQMNANAAASNVKLQTATVTRGNLIATVSEAGNIAAPTTASVAFQTSGTVAKVNVQVGDAVKKGQVLMSLDPTNLQLAVKTAQTNLVTAQANLSSAKIKAAQAPQQLIAAKATLDNAAVALQQAQAAYDVVAWRADVAMTSQAAALQTATNNYQSALANYNITASNYTDTSAVQTAQASVDQAQIALQQAQNNLAEAQIVAPIDGKVTTVNFNVGDTASGVAVVIADVKDLQVKATVAEIDIPSIKVGQTAQLLLDALPNKTYTATIASIDPVGTVTSGVVNYTVIANLTDPDGDVLPGMTTTINVETDSRTNVLIAPLRAIHTQGTIKTATVLYNDQQILVPVTTGLSDNTSVEITSGLKAGDVLVLNATTTTTPRGGFGPGILFGRGG